MNWSNQSADLFCVPDWCHGPVGPAEVAQCHQADAAGPSGPGDHQPDGSGRPQVDDPAAAARPSALVSTEL